MTLKIKFLFYIFVFVILAISVSTIFVEDVLATDYTWKTDVSGDWLTADNWDPSGFSNINSDTAQASSGTLQCGITATFEPKMTLNTGAVILGATANARIWTLRDLVLNGGTLRSQGGNSSFVGTIEAYDGITSYLDSGNGTFSSSSNTWTLKGNGILEKIGTSFWGLPNSSSDFTGELRISEGVVRGTSGTITFGGSGGKIRLNPGSRFVRGSSSSTWTLTGGMYLNGGTYVDNGNNGTIWTTTTNFIIEDESAIYIEGAATGNRPFARLEGALQGSGGLTISESSNNNRGVSFRITEGTYTGELTLGTNAYVYLGINIFDTDGAGSIIIDSDAHLLTIGAYKSTDNTMNVDDIDIILTSLTINGELIEAGVYDQNNVGDLGGFVAFNNSTSSITVLGSDEGELFVDIVDGDGISVSNPTVNMDPVSFSYSHQTSSGVFGISSEKIRVTNTSSGDSWTLSMAAISNTALWVSDGFNYDFNDPTANAHDGADSDSVGGQLTVNPSIASLSGTCSSSGVTKGTTTSFSEGIVDTITLLTASGAENGCYIDFTGIGLTQSIPKEQKVKSNYEIDFVITVTAS